MDFLASLLSTVPSILSNFNHTSAPYLGQQEALAAQQKNLADALTNNNNPMYQQLFGQYKEQGQQDLASTIAEAQRQNRAGSNLGRTPLLDPERGGEQLFRSLMQGQAGLSQQADSSARQAITGAMGGGTQALQAYGNVTPFSKSASSQDLAGYQGIGDLLKQFASSNKTGYQPSSGWGGY